MGKLKHLIETVHVITYNQDVQRNGYETMQDADGLCASTICVSNKLDPDQVQHYAGPDLDPVYLRGL